MVPNPEVGESYWVFFPDPYSRLTDPPLLHVCRGTGSLVAMLGSSGGSLREWVEKESLYYTEAEAAQVYLDHIHAVAKYARELEEQIRLRLATWQVKYPDLFPPVVTSPSQIRTRLLTAGPRHV